MGARRKAFRLAEAMAGPVVFAAVVWAIGAACEALRAMPWTCVPPMAPASFGGFRTILRTGARAGMPIVLVAGPTLVTGTSAVTSLHAVRDRSTGAALLSFVPIPIHFAALPPRIATRVVEAPAPSSGDVAVGAAHQAVMLTGLSFRLSAGPPPSDMVVAAMVLVLPARRAGSFEDTQRVRATLHGGGAALLVLGPFTLSPHLPVPLGPMLLAGLLRGPRMTDRRHPSTICRCAFSVILALIAGALPRHDPAHPAFTRVALTVTGAGAAAPSVAPLDAATGWRGAQPAVARASGPLKR